MNTEQIRAKDAEALLKNPVYLDAIKALGDSYDRKMLMIDVDNKDLCARVVLAKQLLKGIEREIARFIDQGYIEDMIELDKAKRADAMNPRTMER
jgi:hypothetical protein